VSYDNDSIHITHTTVHEPQSELTGGKNAGRQHTRRTSVSLVLTPTSPKAGKASGHLKNGAKTRGPTQPDAIVVAEPDALGVDFNALCRSIRISIDDFESNFVRHWIEVADQLAEAKRLYDARYGKGRGKRNPESIPDFATAVAERIGRSASLVTKYLRVADLDGESRKQVSERPALGRDFSTLLALARATPEKRKEGIEAYDREGEAGLKRVLLKPRNPKTGTVSPEGATTVTTPMSSPAEAPAEPLSITPYERLRAAWTGMETLLPVLLVTLEEPTIELVAQMHQTLGAWLQEAAKGRAQHDQRHDEEAIDVCEVAEPIIEVPQSRDFPTETIVEVVVPVADASWRDEAIVVASVEAVPVVVAAPVLEPRTSAVESTEAEESAVEVEPAVGVDLEAQVSPVNDRDDANKIDPVWLSAGRVDWTPAPSGVGGVLAGHIAKVRNAEIVVSTRAGSVSMTSAGTFVLGAVGADLDALLGQPGKVFDAALKAKGFAQSDATSFRRMSKSSVQAGRLVLLGYGDERPPTSLTQLGVGTFDAKGNPPLKLVTLVQDGEGGRVVRYDARAQFLGSSRLSIFRVWLGPLEAATAPASKGRRSRG